MSELFEGNLDDTGNYTYLVNGRLHVTNMSDILWNSHGSFRCEIFDEKSEVFNLNSVKGEPGSPRLKPEWKCFIPSLVGSGSNFTGNQDSDTIQIRESIRQGSTYYLETLCHPCPVDEFEDDSCRDAEAQFLWTENFARKIDRLRQVVTPNFDGALHSLVYISPDISHNLGHNIGSNQEQGAAEILFTRYLSQYSYKEEDIELEIKNFVHLKMNPSVFMEYRTKEDMEMFESSKWRMRLSQFKLEWSRRTQFDPVNEPVVLTCHVQGIELKNWKLEWLHDGEIIKSSSKQLKITERRIRKFNSYRKPLEKKATQEFCKTYFPESEEKCNADQKLFEFLPANAVEVLPNFGDLRSFEFLTETSKWVPVIRKIFEQSSPMYARMDLEIQPEAARGSYQCRVVSREKNEIRSFLFLDDSDVYYTPAVISLAQFQPDLKFKLTDVGTSLVPMKLQCTLDGLEESDLTRFELTPAESRAKGNMMAEPGKYPYFEWKLDGEPLTPGVGNKIYQASDESTMSSKTQCPFYQSSDWNHLRSFWCKNDPEDPFRFSSISQNIFAVTREKQKSKRVRQTAIMKIYDFGTRDSGTYSCGLDYARSPVVLRPFSAPENDPFPVHILDLIPKTQELQGKTDFGFVMKWSVPYDPCRTVGSEGKKFPEDIEIDMSERCEDFKQVACDNPEEGNYCESAIKKDWIYYRNTKK